MTKKILPYRLFDVIERPIITEKTTRNSEYNQVAFVVRMDSTKPLIKAAVEHVFNVKVKAVNTLVVKGKEKRFRGRMGQQSDFKKAMVTLVKGHTIDLAAGA